jgi:hypothetical protein
MASPPIDPVIHIPHEDAYKISGRDMLILREALILKARNESLEKEFVSLKQQLEKYQERYGEL